MDRFVYNYHTLGGQPSNRLNYVVDNGTDYSAYDDIKSGQSTGNYTYNKIGELIEDTQEDMILHWRTGDHKLLKIERTDDDSPEIDFHYNPFGQRTMKVEKSRTSGVIDPASEWKYTYYVYDANGQVMAVYTGNFQGASEQVKLSEQHLYGAERLGMINRDVVVFDNGVTSYTHKEKDVVHLDIRGHKRYELTNHLGNVLAVINDRKMYNSTDQNYEPVMLSWSDFYAFGMQMPGRNGGVNYRYQFNGMEHDGEVSGNGNSYTTEFRQYDPRLGRWKSLDPLMAKFPHSSPYVAFANNPVYFTDPYGLEPVNDGGDGGDGGGDTFPENPNEGDDFMRTDAKGTEWHYKYENGVWVGQGGEINNDRDIVVTPGNKATYDQARSSVKSGNLDRFEFNRQYKMYDWCRYDPNCNNFRGTAMHRRLQEQFDLVVYEEAIKIYKAIAIAAVSFAGGAALFESALVVFKAVAPVVNSTARLVPKAAKAYHYGYGLPGGYWNMGWNIYNQSVGNIGNGGKINVLGVVTAGFTTYRTGIVKQMVLGGIGSGAFVSIDTDGDIKTMLDNPWHINTTTFINGALYSPWGGALTKELGLGQHTGNFIISTTSGGLQNGINRVGELENSK